MPFESRSGGGHHFVQQLLRPALVADPEE